MFLNDTYRPITDSVGLFACPSAPLATAYAAWMEGNVGPESRMAIRQVASAAMAEHLSQLAPLVKVGMTRVLFEPVNPAWTACFTNGWRGTDMSSIVPTLSQRLGCIAIRVTCVPDLGKGARRRYGARIVEYHDGSRLPSRVISVANDGGRWVQHLGGDMLAAEEPAWLNANNVRDRFTPLQLQTLVGRLVPGLWGMSDTITDALLVERVGSIPATFAPVDLETVQASIPTDYSCRV